MKCPFSAIGYKIKGIIFDCLREDCALWNNRFGMCCIAVDAYLKSQEDWRKKLWQIQKANARKVDKQLKENKEKADVDKKRPA